MQKGQAVLFQTLVGNFEIGTIILLSNVLEHADGIDPVEEALKFSVVSNLDGNWQACAIAACSVETVTPCTDTP